MIKRILKNTSDSRAVEIDPLAPIRKAATKTTTSQSKGATGAPTKNGSYAAVAQVSVPRALPVNPRGTKCSKTRARQ